MMRFLSATALGLLLFAAGCRYRDEPDAYGNVEATEVVVSAEASGRIESFTVREGDTLAAGAIVGHIETTPLTLQKREVSAEHAASASRINEIARQIESLQVQREIARRAYERTRRLYAQQAATASQLDQAEREDRVLGEQIGAARVQQQTIRKQMEAGEARMAQVSDRIEKATIRNPIGGTVLSTYVEAGEVAPAGQPLYRIADLGTVEVRAYIAETQLASVRVGQSARVSVDAGKDVRRVIDGTVTWVSSDAEFTPTPIQTREERGDLVYAVKIRVPNPAGVLKIGMPADVAFVAPTASR